MCCSGWCVPEPPLAHLSCLLMTSERPGACVPAQRSELQITQEEELSKFPRPGKKTLSIAAEIKQPHCLFSECFWG